MICFEVYVNGEKICLAGVGESGVLSSIVSWGGRQGRPEIKPDLHIGGLVDKEHVAWTKKMYNLEVGDEVTLKIVEADTADEPIRKFPSESSHPSSGLCTHMRNLFDSLLHRNS